MLLWRVGFIFYKHPEVVWPASDVALEFGRTWKSEQGRKLITYLISIYKINSHSVNLPISGFFMF